MYFGGDPIGSDLTEHTIDFYGKAPGSNKKRRFHLYKAVSIDFGAMTHSKGTETLLPVSFEALADTTKPRGRRLGFCEDET